NVAWVIARITDSFFVEFLIPISHKATSDLNDMIIPFLRKGTKFIIWTIGIIIGLNNAGYDVGALIAGLGIGGVAVALAARNTISNVFGGVTIFIDQPFRIGDKIRVISRVRGIEGKVLDVGLRLTTLESSDGSVILVPNATFAVDPVENKSKEPSKKITTYLKLHKNNPSEKIQLAIDLLTEMVNKNEDLVSTPIVTFDSIEDMYLGILFIYFIDKEKDSGLVQSKLNMKIIEDFEKNEIKFAQNITSPTEYDPD
ncbi:MAG: mechanosensitive ion channel, partial [Leptospiraceae bacterium]|nr:mechanosensitive ion channel [Leptospiraceae bacterium]